MGARHPLGYPLFCLSARPPAPGARREDFKLKMMNVLGGPASSAELMTPEQRFEEVAAILARGCRRAIRNLPNGSPRDIRATDESDVPVSDLSTPNPHE